MNASDILKYGDSFLQRTLESIPDSEWDTENVCGWWSVKNIMSHLTSYEVVLSELLQNFLDDSPTPTLMAMADHGLFNDVQVAARKDKSPAEVRDEYNAMHAKNMGLIAQFAPEKLREVGTLPWYGMEYALDDYIVYSFYGHKREHGAQIDVFKDKLKAARKIKAG
jgi:hypothetical protein